MREDKAKKTGKDEIDGWNRVMWGAGGGERKGRLQKRSNKVYKNYFSDLNKKKFLCPIFLIILYNDIDSAPGASISERNKS